MSIYGKFQELTTLDPTYFQENRYFLELIWIYQESANNDQRNLLGHFRSTLNLDSQNYPSSKELFLLIEQGECLLGQIRGLFDRYYQYFDWEGLMDSSKSLLSVPKHFSPQCLS